MKNGVPLRCDPDFKDFLIDIQEQRFNSGKDKHKKNLTKISSLAFNILKLNKNVDRMLKGRC